MLDSNSIKTCCFTGHRPDKLPWRNDEQDQRCLVLKAWLLEAIEQAWQDGYRHFLVGMALGCDLYFCEAALAFRATHPEIRVEAAIPYPGQADRWSARNRARWQSLVDRCDLQTVVQPTYDWGCLLRRDRYMVARSGRIIAVFNGTSGGTMQTLAYAMRDGLEIVRIDPDTL